MTPGGIVSGALPMLEERVGVVVNDLEGIVRWRSGEAIVRMKRAVVGVCIVRCACRPPLSTNVIEGD